MSLNAKEKLQVYKEELEKQKQQEQDETRNKVESLTDEEKTRIFEELNKKNVTLVEEENLLFPNKKQQTISGLIHGGVFFVLWFFVSFMLAIVWFIGGFIVQAVLGFRNIVIDTPKISYSCFHCGNVHVNILRAEEIKEAEDTGFIHAKCNSCKKDFNLVVIPEVLNHFKKK